VFSSVLVEALAFFTETDCISVFDFVAEPEYK